MALQKANDQDRNLQLEVLDSQYQVFVPDQVLTHENLNEITRFFETQSRLTRTALIGVGVVCGLQTEFSAKKVKISKGIAVTTDGDLFYLQDTSFGHFRVYDNNDAHYEPFFPAPGDKQVPLFELVLPDPQGQLPIKSLSLSDFSKSSEIPVTEMCVLLYAEYYLKEPTLCTTIDCENQGKTQVNRLKVLLISKADMEKVIAHEAESKSEFKKELADDLYRNYFKASDVLYHLPRIRAKRVFINQATVQSYKNLKDAYFNTVRKDINRVTRNIKEMLTPFTFLLGKISLPDPDDFAEKILEETNKTNNRLYVQYLYDFYADLVDAYNELHEVLSDLVLECGPGLYNFPKHIMLGQVGASLEAMPVPRRHIFYPSPVNTVNKEQLGIAKTMLERLIRMTRLFFVPETEKIHGIHVTPSMDTDRKLEERAIPFYYDYNPRLQLHPYWNYKKTRHGQEDSVLSYYGDIYGGKYDETNNPLDYNLDPFNFFRIEGHIGKDYRQKMRELKDIRDRNNLPFDIVSIRLGNPNLKDIDMEDYRCEFEDLETMVRAWKKEQDCLNKTVRTFFSSFSLEPKDRVSVHLNLEKVNKFKGLVYTRFLDHPITVGGTGYDDASSTSELEQRNRAIATQTIGNFISSLNIVFQKAEDIINKVNLEAAENAIIRAMPEDEREVRFETPLAVIAYISEASKYIPSGLSSINLGSLLKYRPILKNMCDFVQSARTRMENIFNSDSYQKTGIEQQYLYLLGLLSANCCAGEKLEEIYNEVEKRKRNILQNLTLSKFLENHPGLEHKAGVHRGGTFVIVYAGKEKRTVSNPLSRWLSMGKTTGFDKEQLGVNMLLYFRENQKELKNLRRKNASLYKLIKEQLDLPREDTVEDLIIADFCLPYLCCSSCPPVAYVFEKAPEPEPVPAPTPDPTPGPEPEKVSLALKQKTACNKENLIPFIKIIPPDGLIESPEAPGAIIKEPVMAFDPSLVPEDKLGKPVTFTINDKPTGCVITVYRKPEPGFEVKETQYEDDLIRLILYNNTIFKKVDEMEFTWNVTSPDGNSDLPFTSNTDGTEVTLEIPRDKIEKLGLDFLVVTLIASNPACNSRHQAKVGIELKKSRPCNENMLDILKAAYGRLPSAEVVNKQFQSDSLVAADSQVRKLYDEIMAQIRSDGQYQPTQDIIIRIRRQLDAMMGLNLTEPPEKEYAAQLWILLIILMFSILRCSECKTLEDIKNILPQDPQDPQDKFSTLILNLFDHYYPNDDQKEQLRGFITDYLENSLCMLSHKFLVALGDRM